MKKIRIAIICLVVTLLFLVKQESMAAEYSLFEDYKYVVVEDGSAICIKEYIGRDIYVTVPSQIEGKPVWYIGEAFYENRTIQKVVLPDGLKVVSGFDGCENLKDIYIPNTVVKVDNFAFANCINLEKLNLPNGIVEIGDYAFYNCKSLKEIVIPNSVKVIEQAAFLDCKKLKKVTLSKSLTELNWETFKGCKSLKSITIPNGIKRIGDEAFYGCKALKKISLPNSLLRIDNTVFHECGFTQVTIPKNVTHIGWNVFYSCEKLKKVKIKSTKVKHFGFGALGGINEKAVVDVPNKCLKKYKKMLNGRDFDAKLK